MLTRSIPHGSLLPPWAWVRDVTRKIHRLEWPSECYPLLVIQVGRNVIEYRSAKAVKRDFKALG